MSVSRVTRQKATQSGTPSKAQNGETARAAKTRKHKNSANIPPIQKRRIWSKTATWLILIGVPCAAFILVFFVWQLGNTLDRIAAHNKQIENSQQYSSKTRKLTAFQKFKSSKMSFGQFLAYGQEKGMQDNTEPYSNLRFLHTGLIYSSILVLVATICIVLMMIYFILRDRHFRRQYQNLLAKTENMVERRVRSRTARCKSAQKLAEKERQRAELLLQDSSHRIGNSLATVSSLLGLQLRQCNDKQVQQALISARDRIQTISAAHRRLRLNKDMETVAAGEFFNAVIHDVETGLTIRQRSLITIQSRFEHWYLPARDVTTLGIILGELLTNAVKHAFPDNQKGRIYVSFGKLNSKNLRLIVEDDGIGLPPEVAKEKMVNASRHTPGLGKLIISQLAQQFNAKPQFTNSKKGGSRIVIPLLNIKAEHEKR